MAEADVQSDTGAETSVPEAPLDSVAAAVTPSAVVTVSGASVTFKAVAAGTIIPVQVKQVLNTGTTTAADTILGLA
jgi:hypothetical protein